VKSARKSAPDASSFEPHVINGRLISTVLAYAEMKLGRDTALAMFDGALAGSGVSREQALDPRGWVPLSILERTGDVFEPRLGTTCITDAFTWAVPRRIDWSAMSLSALTTPTFMMRRLDRARTFFARHLRYDVTLLGPGHARIALHYASVNEGPRRTHSCKVAKGVIKGVPTIFDMPPAVLTETACCADGHPSCIYDVRWRTEPAYAWIGFSVGLTIAIVGYLLWPGGTWALSPALGWLLGRELRSYRLRGYMTKLSEEHQRALADSERDFQRRYDEIKELNDKLEQRVAERTKELTQTLTALREGNTELRRTIEEMRTIHGDVLDAGVRNMLGRAVEEFAHELKNPMTTVLANMQFLEDSDSGASDLGELGDVARDIRDAVYRMRAVIGWFIELYETDTVPSACPLHEHIQQMTEAMGRQWRGRVNLETHVEDITVDARGMQLLQVLENLLNNAAQADGTKNVIVRARREDGMAKILVQDDGPGIPSDVLPKIFERGFTTKHGRGSGLGLYISKAIVERHQGKLVASSQPGKGASFELTLPLRVEAKASPSRIQIVATRDPDPHAKDDVVS
jgi:signal transduction histidine kinase